MGTRELPPAHSQLKEMGEPQKELSSWFDVLDWRATVDVELGNHAFSDEHTHLDVWEQPNIGHADNSSSSTSASPRPDSSEAGSFQYSFIKDEPQSTEINSEVISHPVSAPFLPRSTTTVGATREEVLGATTRLPKWKRRNAQKHLDGERNRRAKRKNKIKTLSALLPQLKGKVTTNDLLEATLKKVREQLHHRRACGVEELSHRGVLLGCGSMACFALDGDNRVVEASSSFLTWLNWPRLVPVAGQHVSCLLPPAEAMRLVAAIGEERALRGGEGGPAHMQGVAHFVRFEHKAPPHRTHAPVEVEVTLGPDERTLCHFLLPRSS